MTAGEQSFRQPGARPVRAPLLRRAQLVRAALTTALAAAGVALSALAFGAVWPDGAAAPKPAPLSAAEAAAARALVARAQELVSVTPADLGYRLRVAGPVAGIRGQADAASRTITLFVSPQMQPHQVAHDLAHEIGHALDAQRLSGVQRAVYLRARGVPEAAWWPGHEASDYRSGAGDFAEVFALCHATSPEFRSRLAPRPEDPCGLLPKQARGANLGGAGS
jgi:hypothetical protein